MMAVIGFSMVACASEEEDDPELPTLLFRVRSSEDGAIVGCTLQAEVLTVKPGDTFTYQWKLDGILIETIETRWQSSYTTDATGSYTVSVSGHGYKGTKTSDPIVVEPDNRPELEGTITIQPATAEVGTLLEAQYSGSENVSYVWNSDTIQNIAYGNGKSSYRPYTAGNYTVTVSAKGSKNKITSEPAAVTLPAKGLFDSSNPQNYLGKKKKKKNDYCDFTTPTGYKFSTVYFSDPWKSGTVIYFRLRNQTGQASITDSYGNKYTVFFNKADGVRFYVLSFDYMDKPMYENYYPQSRYTSDGRAENGLDTFVNTYQVNSRSGSQLGIPEPKYILPPLVVVE
jgi:hypothetical protein